MADSFDCGRREHEAWRRGAEHITRYLGPYNPSLPLSDVHRIFEHEKLTQGFRDAYERGWLSINKESK